MAKITFKNDNKTVEANSGDTFLDICESNDSSILFGCTNGVCGTCKTKVLKGQEAITPVTETEKESLERFDAAENERLLCQCSVKDQDGDIELEQ